MTAVVIPFLGRGKVAQVAPLSLNEADVDFAQRDVERIAPERLRLEATASLEIATGCAGTAEGLVWEVRALFCLTRMLDAALPPDRRMEA